jgi:hypothetical protein
MLVFLVEGKCNVILWCTPHDELLRASVLRPKTSQTLFRPLRAPVLQPKTSQTLFGPLRAPVLRPKTSQTLFGPLRAPVLQPKTSQTLFGPLRAQVLRPKTSQTLFGPVIFLNKLGPVNSNFHFKDWYLCNWNPPSNSGVKQRQKLQIKNIFRTAHYICKEQEQEPTSVWSYMVTWDIVVNSMHSNVSDFDWYCIFSHTLRVLIKQIWKFTIRKKSHQNQTWIKI